MTEGTASSPGVRLPWAGKNVRIEQAEEELAFLWRMSADNVRGTHVNVRTSVLNFVICAPDTETAKQASALLRDLSSTHLARVIVLILDPNSSPNAVTTWVTLRCFSILSDLMRHCFEQVTILPTGSAVRAAANIIHSILKPDLPVYMWWLGDPPQDVTTFRRLVETSNRVIVDSIGFLNPEQDIQTLALLLQATSDCALSDLNWGRLTPWRQLVLQFFNAEYRTYLEAVTSLEIEHAVAPLATSTRNERGDVSPNPTAALLLAGWLKSQLGWTLSQSAHVQRDTTSGTYYWSLEAPGRAVPVSISIRPQVQPAMRPGSICLVRLSSTSGGQQAIFTIDREGDPDHVLTSVELSRETRPQRTVKLASVESESELLHDELEIMGHDVPFEATLQEVATLLA